MKQKFIQLFVVTGIITAMIFVRPDRVYAADRPDESFFQKQEKIYTVETCTVLPKFKTGDKNEFVKWVFNEIVYPPAAVKNKVQGRVILEFVINANGTVSDVRVARGVNEELDAEAVRVVSDSPEWEPGRDEKGNPVKVRMTFPVVFALR